MDSVAFLRSHPVIDLPKEELAYIAGIIDGEGTISLRFPPYPAVTRPYLGISNTSKVLMDWLTKRLGYGYTEKRYSPKTPSGNYRDYSIYLLRISGFKVQPIIASILPYLV